MSYKVRDFVRPALRVADLPRADPLVENLGRVLAAQSESLRAQHPGTFSKVDELLAGPRPNMHLVLTGGHNKLRKWSNVKECARCGDPFVSRHGYKTCSVKCGVEHRQFLRARA